jgi:superfamily II DNA/RNA helicase
LSRFADLGVPAAVVASLAARGMTQAFPIQSLAIPPALAGRDVCGRAPTGSGKTLAFGIPLAERVSRARPGHPRALVLAPTRELAAQIQAELRPLLATRKRSVASFYGGVGFGPQLKVLRRGVDVAVACPGRLADLVRRGDLILDEVEIAVVDEADRMADMGFLPEVKRILDQVQPDRQTLLFSATLDGDVDVLVRRYQREPQRCDVQTDKSDGTRTTHTFVRARREDRVAVTADLIAAHGSTLVFCRTKHGANRVADQLTRRGISAVPIHGSRSQAQRDRALRTFAAGHAQALVATDVVARGIHVDNIECVVHYDLAGDHKDYVHRSGRTGRAGATGVVVSLVTDADAAQALRLQKSVGLPVESGGSSTQVGTKGQPLQGRTTKASTGRKGRMPANARARSRRRTVKS